MTLNKTTCPSCGANINTKSDDKEITCQYCSATFNNETELKEQTVIINNTINNVTAPDTKIKKSRKWLWWTVGICAGIILFLGIGLSFSA